MAGPFSYLVETPSRLDIFLVQKSGLSRQFIQEQIKAGRISRNEALTSKSSQKLQSGDRITGAFVEIETLALSPIAHPLDVIFEDEDLLIINKAQGVVVHPAAGHRGETLVHYLLHYLGTNPSFATLSSSRPGIVHRLDRGTSGLLIVAKNRITQEALSTQFKLRLIKKEYECIAWGKTKPKGTVKSIIGRDLVHRKRMSSNTEKGRDALTHWERAEEFTHFSHVQLFPHTGRTHQLRVHLSESGHPIVGDQLYGRRSSLKQILLLSPQLRGAIEAARFPFLHARRLELAHPKTGEPLIAEVPAPENFETLLWLLRSQDR